MPAAQKKRNESGIKTIPRSRFDRLVLQNFALESLMGEEVEWFSSRSGNLLGTVAKAAGVAGWNYAVLKRDGNGDFRVRKLMNSFFGLKHARVDLLLSMAGFTELERLKAKQGNHQMVVP